MSEPKPDKYKVLRAELERDIRLMARLSALPGNPGGLTPDDAEDALRRLIRDKSLQEQVDFVQNLKEMRGLPRSFSGMSADEIARVLWDSMKGMPLESIRDQIAILRSLLGLPPGDDPSAHGPPVVREAMAEGWRWVYGNFLLSAGCGVGIPLMVAIAAVMLGETPDLTMMMGFGVGLFFVVFLLNPAFSILERLTGRRP